MDDLKDKLKFAKELYKDDSDPFKAALNVFGVDTAKALIASSKWVNDEVVLEVIDLLKKDDGFDDDDLPSKKRAAKDIYHRALRALEDKDFAVLMKLFGDYMGYTAKEAAPTINNNVTNRVMVIREFATDEEWKKGLIEQQRKLTNASAIN